MSFLSLNKKGADPQSVIIAIISLFVAGIIIVLFSNMFGQIYDQVDVFLNESDGLGGAEAQEAIQEINLVEHSAWDYAIIVFVIGYLLVLGFTAFATRISNFFLFVYIILAMIGLFLGVIFANTWQTMAETPAMTETIARFPITNAILGSYFPTVVLAIIVISMILLFGKPFGGEQ